MGNIKILIMVLSYNEPPYDSLMKMQQATWDSIEVEGVRTVYYHGGGLVNKVEKFPYYTTIHNVSKNSIRLEYQCTDEYYLMAGKFSRCLEDLLNPPTRISEYRDFDIIFRTNSSSYVNKEKLKEFAATLPTEKLYAGWEIEGNAGYNVVSGAGIFLSRDTAEILREKIDPNFEREEDVYCGQLLHEAGIKIINDRSRFDVPMSISEKEISLDRYHYRFESTQNRLADIGNMKMLHKLITA